MGVSDYMWTGLSTYYILVISTNTTKPFDPLDFNLDPCMKDPDSLELRQCGQEWNLLPPVWAASETPLGALHPLGHLAPIPVYTVIYKCVHVTMGLWLTVRTANNKCDPTTRNEWHWYLVKIQSVTIFDLQVKNIDFSFSSKLGASGIFLFESITLNGQMWCFMAVSGILNCNCCNTVVCNMNFLSPISQNGTLYGNQTDSPITLEPVGRLT